MGKIPPITYRCMTLTGWKVIIMLLCLLHTPLPVQGDTSTSLTLRGIIKQVDLIDNSFLFAYARRVLSVTITASTRFSGKASLEELSPEDTVTVVVPADFDHGYTTADSVITRNKMTP